MILSIEDLQLIKFILENFLEFSEFSGKEDEITAIIEKIDFIIDLED